MRDLVQALSFDEFVTVIDLRKNCIQREGIQMILDLLQNYNKSIINIDIRDNPGAIPEYHSELAYKLVKNVHNCKRDKEYFRLIVEREWINKEILLAYMNGANKGKSQ